MKLFICALLTFFASGNIIAQNASDTSAPYRRYPEVPPFSILETDSVSLFSKADLKKNKPVLIIVFSPDCEHCQHETEEIIRHMDEFKKVQIIMATMMPFASMKNFYTKFELAKFNNIKVGKDIQNMLPSFYMVHNLPYLAMYDKKGKLLSTFEGNMKIEDLVKVFN
jgi:thioredoxin-related protein